VTWSEHQPAGLAQGPQPPGVVYAAAVVTWVGATVTAAFTLLMTVGTLWVLAPMFDAFDSGTDNPRWWLIEAAAIVVAVSVAADVTALFLLRGHRWARWVLLGLCVLAALGGVMAAYYIAPLVVTAGAIAVAVLLFLPDARRWFRESRMTDRESGST
jgi:hypothetical protein